MQVLHECRKKHFFFFFYISFSEPHSRLSDTLTVTWTNVDFLTMRSSDIPSREMFSWLLKIKHSQAVFKIYTFEITATYPRGEQYWPWVMQ